MGTEWTKAGGPQELFFIIMIKSRRTRTVDCQLAHFPFKPYASHTVGAIIRPAQAPIRAKL
jgi:hypothetical protein